MRAVRSARTPPGLGTRSRSLGAGRVGKQTVNTQFEDTLICLTSWLHVLIFSCCRGSRGSGGRRGTATDHHSDKLDPSAGANSWLSPVDDNKEWNPYARGAHRRASPDHSIAPDPLPAPAAQPVAAVASRLATVRPNYALPPLFRDTFEPHAVKELLADRFNTKVLMDEEVEVCCVLHVHPKNTPKTKLTSLCAEQEAWQAAIKQTSEENSLSNSGTCASAQSVRRALGKLYELPRSILDAALRYQLPVADTREARHRAGYARGERRPPVYNNAVVQLTCDRFRWLARYLAHFEQLWFLCECLEEHEDVPLTLGEFERAV